jgi:hypothetical protein
VSDDGPWFFPGEQLPALAHARVRALQSSAQLLRKTGYEFAVGDTDGRRRQEVTVSGRSPGVRHCRQQLLPCRCARSIASRSYLVFFDWDAFAFVFSGMMTLRG